MNSRDRTSNDSSDDDSADIADGLSSLQNEFYQLSVLDEKERNFTKKLIESLKALQSQVDVTIPLLKESIGPAAASAREAYLASECIIIIVGEDGVKRSIPLARFEPKYVLSIAREATPGLAVIISEKRRQISSRVDIFAQVLKDVENARNMAKQTERAISQAAGDDLVQNEIASE